MATNNGKQAEPKRPSAMDILAKGGLTPTQIARARLKNFAEDTAWTIFIAQTVLVAGIETMQKLMPDVPPDVIKQWAEETLKAARMELDKAKNAKK